MGVYISKDGFYGHDRLLVNKHGCEMYDHGFGVGESQAHIICTLVKFGLVRNTLARKSVVGFSICKGWPQGLAQVSISIVRFNKKIMVGRNDYDIARE